MLQAEEELLSGATIMFITWCSVGGITKLQIGLGFRLGLGSELESKTPKGFLQGFLLQGGSAVCTRNRRKPPGRGFFSGEVLSVKI